MGPETMISMLAVTLLGTGWALFMLPIGQCSQCMHCRLERVARDQETEAQASRIYGIPRCQACGRHHQRGEDHLR